MKFGMAAKIFAEGTEFFAAAAWPKEPKVGQRAPDVELTLMDGSKTTLAEHKAKSLC